MGDKLTRRTLDAWIKSGDNEAWRWRLAKRRRVALGEYPAITPEQAAAK